MKKRKTRSEKLLILQDLLIHKKQDNDWRNQKSTRGGCEMFIFDNMFGFEFDRPNVRFNWKLLEPEIWSNLFLMRNFIQKQVNAKADCREARRNAAKENENLKRKITRQAETLQQQEKAIIQKNIMIKALLEYKNK